MVDIIIYVNEKKLEVDNNIYLYDIRDKYKQDADLLIINGFPTNTNKQLKDLDRIVLIKKGEMPKQEELESLIIARNPTGVYEKLKNAKVGIAGLGGLGSTIAVALARSGVGELTLVDFDIVEPSNLNRQHYFIEDIGKYKVNALEEIIKKINPFIKVNTIKTTINESNARDIFNDCKIIVEAFDNKQSKAELVNEILTNTNKIIVAASGMAGYFSNNSIVTKKINDRLYLIGDGVNEAKENQGLMAGRVGIAAHHQANTVIRLILGEKEV